MVKSLKIFFIFFSTFLFFLSLSFAKNITICNSSCDFTSINLAIENSSDYDNLLISNNKNEDLNLSKPLNLICSSSASIKGKININSSNVSFKDCNLKIEPSSYNILINFSKDNLENISFFNVNFLDTTTTNKNKVFSFLFSQNKNLNNFIFENISFEKSKDREDNFYGFNLFEIKNSTFDIKKNIEVQNLLSVQNFKNQNNIFSQNTNSILDENNILENEFDNSTKISNENLISQLKNNSILTFQNKNYEDDLKLNLTNLKNSNLFFKGRNKTTFNELIIFENLLINNLELKNIDFSQGIKIEKNSTILKLVLDDLNVEKSQNNNIALIYLNSNSQISSLELNNIILSVKNLPRFFYFDENIFDNLTFKNLVFNVSKNLLSPFFNYEIIKSKNILFENISFQNIENQNIKYGFKFLNSTNLKILKSKFNDFEENVFFIENSKDSQILNNTFSNSKNPIYFDNLNENVNSKINENIFLDISQNFVKIVNFASTNLFNLTYNFFNSAFGPKHSTQNLNGEILVSNYTNILPFYLDEKKQEILKEKIEINENKINVNKNNTLLNLNSDFLENLEIHIDNKSNENIFLNFFPRLNSDRKSLQISLNKISIFKNISNNRILNALIENQTNFLSDKKISGVINLFSYYQNLSSLNSSNSNLEEIGASIQVLNYENDTINLSKDLVINLELYNNFFIPYQTKQDVSNLKNINKNLSKKLELCSNRNENDLNCYEYNNFEITIKMRNLSNIFLLKSTDENEDERVSSSGSKSSKTSYQKKIKNSREILLEKSFENFFDKSKEDIKNIKLIETKEINFKNNKNNFEISNLKNYSLIENDFLIKAEAFLYEIKTKNEDKKIIFVNLKSINGKLENKYNTIKNFFKINGLENFYGNLEKSNTKDIFQNNFYNVLEKDDINYYFILNLDDLEDLKKIKLASYQKIYDIKIDEVEELKLFDANKKLEEEVKKQNEEVLKENSLAGNLTVFIPSVIISIFLLVFIVYFSYNYLRQKKINEKRNKTYRDHFDISNVIKEIREKNKDRK